MSPICQTFVQNAWRKDLCSNCFKSKEEHEGSYACNQTSRREYSTEGPLVRRYLGVTGRSIYSRNYYGNPGNTWNSSILDSKDAGALKSPGLINRMDSLIKQENEKNSHLNSLNMNEDDPIHNNGFHSSDLVDSSSIKREAWFLSDIIGDTKNFELTEDKSQKDRDCSSDLGSDASHDTSVSSSDNSACSDIASSGRSSSEFKEVDSDSVKSYADDNTAISEPAVASILKTSAEKTYQKFRLKISFGESEQIIGYGGDVDYSDDEDDYDDDDDDDWSICSLEMPLDERELKYLTEHNTNFNSEIENFEKDENKSKEQSQPSIKVVEYPQVIKDDSAPKQEGRVKLKRCPPLVTTKPLIRAIIPTSTSTLSKKTESLSEDVPMKGIKPKYVSREEEMKEKWECDFDLVQDKVTSIDETCSKVTSIDEYLSTSVNSDEDVISKVGCDDPKITTFNDMVLGSSLTNDSSNRLPTDDAHIVNSFSNKTTDHVSSGTKEITPSNEKIASAGEPSMLDVKELLAHEILPAKEVENDDIISSDQLLRSKVNSCSKEETKAEDSRKEDFSDSASLTKSSSDDNVDYTVRSAHSIVANFHPESLSCNDESNENLDRIRSAVIPMNMITIQRRNSFMESQLGGPIYAANEVNALKAPSHPNDQGSTNKSKVGCSTSVPLRHLRKTKANSEASDSETNESSLGTVLQRVTQCCDDSSMVRNKPHEGISEIISSEISSNASSKSTFNKEHANKPSFTPASPTSTFGTPFANAPQTSFLHTGGIKALQNAMMNNSAISTEMVLFPPQPLANEPTPTACIKKSAIYASPSCLKGLPFALAKPATTPKPNFLKDKPKLPIKPCLIGSYSSQTSSMPIRDKIYSSPRNLTPTDNIPSNVESHLSVHQEIEIAAQSFRDRTSEFSAVASTEIVYDVPVTSSPCNTTSSPVSSSSGYSTTSQTSLLSNIQAPHEESNRTEIQNESPTKPSESSNISQNEGCVSQYRATFEANRSLLSSALNIGNNTLLNKRPAPQPPPEEEQQVDTEEHAKENGCSEAATEEVCEQSVSAHTRERLNNPPPHTALNSSPYENLDIESYSSFTDDFEDEDDGVTNENGSDVFVPLRRAERSSSATPLCRNSVGPIFFCPPSSIEATTAGSLEPSHSYGGKLPAVRSHSVPRSIDNAVFPILPAKAKQDSSKFSFVKNGFFRPSSPPSLKRKSASERGRDRSKRTHSGFSLKKLLGFGSSDKALKATKLLKSMKDRDWDRETRKLKLQIIHPLDYNPNGVEVIARPEKTSPIYDYTGIYANTHLPELVSLQSLNTSTKNSFLPQSFADSRSSDSPSPAPSSTVSSSNHSSSDVATGLLGLTKKSKKDLFASQLKNSNKNLNTDKKVEKKNSFLKKRRKPERKESLTFGKPLATYVKPEKVAPTGVENLAENRLSENISASSASHLSNASNLLALSTNGSSLASTEHIPPATEAQCVPIYSNRSLGFNSEGRPKPPPPPRKTSLESSTLDGGASGGSSRSSDSGDIPPSGRSLSTSELSAVGGVRPHRPPPPRRTPSNAGSAPSADAVTARQISHHAKSTLYANLGEARVPITPRKPGRSCSVKDEEKEKRKAPNPPHTSVQGSVETNRNQQQQQQFTRGRNLPEATSSMNSSAGVHLRSSKGPAPPAPTDPHLLHILSHEYEYIDDSPIKNVEKTTKAATSSSSSYSEDKASRQSADESAVRNRSLEDQYGAVVFANLEALSNLLDQVCSQPESNGYKPVTDKVSVWSDVYLTSSDPVSCGSRLFYQARAANFNVTAMVTQEVKVATDPLLMQCPIVSFRDELPTRILLRTKSHERHSTTAGTVWLLPRLTLLSLEEFSHSSQRLLEQHPKQWERHICLFLLQLVTALKQLQAKGIEETSLDLVLVSNQTDQEQTTKTISNNYQYPRLILVSPSQSTITNSISLCHCAAATSQLLLGHSNPIEAGMKGPVLSPPFTPSPHAFSSLINTLREERATSLTRAKCLLEAMLFGPSNIRPSSDPNIEASLQKWLDLERAKVLHSLVSDSSSGTNSSRSIWTKFHLYFLVRTSVKALKDATLSLQVPDVTNF